MRHFLYLVSKTIRSFCPKLDGSTQFKRCRSERKTLWSPLLFSYIKTVSESIMEYMVRCAHFYGKQEYHFTTNHTTSWWQLENRDNPTYYTPEIHYFSIIFQNNANGSLPYLFCENIIPGKWRNFLYDFSVYIISRKQNKLLETQESKYG